MSQANVELIRRANVVLNAGNWEALFELYDPAVLLEIASVPPPDLPEVLHGLEGVRQFVTQWTDAYDEFGAEIYEYVDAHPWVVIDVRWYGRGKGSDVPIDIHVADAYEVKDGKIVTAILGYANVATALKAVGLI